MNDGGAPWIKIITRIFEDPKIIVIGKMTGGVGDGVLVIWFKLLCLAGQQNRDGAIYLTESVSFTLELLATQLRCEPALLRIALKAFQEFEMISIDSDQTIWILNWAKYQNVAGLAQIRERSLKQLQDRSPESVEERRAQKRERDAERQRRWRQSHKKNGSNGAVTRDGGVTGVTGCVTPTPQQREAVTPPENKIENKIEREKKEPPTVPQGGTRENKEPPTVPQGGTRENKEFPLSKGEIDECSKAKTWLNKLFGRSHSRSIRGRKQGWSDRWSDEEHSLLMGLLPISQAERDLIQWGYSLPLDSEGWSLIDGRRVTKPKQTLLALLREFSSEIDKWRSARANHNQASESPLATGAATDEWTPERCAALKKMFPGSDYPGPFHLLGCDLQRQIEAKVKEERDRLTPEWASMMEKLYGADAPIPRLKSHLAPSVRNEIEAALKEEAAMREQAKKSGA